MNHTEQQARHRLTMHQSLAEPDVPLDNPDALLVGAPALLASAMRLLSELPRGSVERPPYERPFALMAGTPIPVWLQIFVSNRNRAANERLALCVAFGKPISPNQTLDDYSSLPLVPLGVPPGVFGNIHKANLIGLTTQASFSPDDNREGEVFLVNCPFPNGVELIGLFCETPGAARRLLEKYGINT